MTYRYRNIGAAPHPAYWCAHPLFRYEPDMEIGAPVSRGLPDGESTKVFLPPGSVDHVSLRWKAGASIDVRWDATLTPEVAIWICNGDLGGYRQVAVEPAPSSPVLEPGSAYEWWLRIDAL